MVAVIISALAGCAQAPPHGDDDGRLLAALLPPESLGKYLSLSQKVVGEFQGQTHSMRVEVEITPTRLVMVGLSHLGLPVFSLTQQGDTIDMEFFADGQPPLDPRYILSDFQKILRREFRIAGKRGWLPRSDLFFGRDDRAEIRLPRGRHC